jgi:hypothetical protein
LATRPDAPFGYKADGTPRKRPAPDWQNDPVKHAAAIAKRTTTARFARAGRPTPPSHAVPAPSDLLDQIALELQQRLAILDAEAAQLHDRLTELYVEQDRLTAARQAIGQ